MKTLTMLYIVPSLKYTKMSERKSKLTFEAQLVKENLWKKTQINKQDSKNKN